MFRVGDGDTGAVCGVCSGLAVKTPERRHWHRIGVFIVEFGHGWCIVVHFGQVNAGWVLAILMTRFLLTNDIFDWFIYFVVIFCRIRLLFTVNITNFNNYLIYIMKSQVFMVLCSVLKYPLVLSPRFVATGWFLYRVGFQLVGVFEQILVLQVLF